MPTFQKEDIDSLHFILSATLAPSDYEPDFKAELAKYRKQASLKGFRKGKTPDSVLRKMFGKSVLADVLNKKLNTVIEEYIRQNDLNVLGGPVPADDNDRIELDTREMQEYTFRYEMGIAPEFEVKGAGAESTYRRYAVDVSDAMIDEELQKLRAEDERESEVEEGFLENDLLYFQIAELEGDAIRENGLNSHFAAQPIQIKDEALRAKVLAAKKGDTLRFNIFTAFDVEEEKILKDWLHTDPEHKGDVNEWFEAVIERAERNEPAPLDQAFFDFIFGEGKVSNEAEARELLRQDLEKMYLKPANSLMFIDIRDRIQEETSLALPENFLKKWLAYSDEEISEQEIEQRFESFINGTRWSLIRNKIARQLDISVEEEELVGFFRNRVRGYFGRTPYINEDFIDDMARRLMENEESLRSAYEDIFTDKIFHALAAQVSIEPVPVTKEEFENVLEERRKSLEPAQPPAADTEMAEVETINSGETTPETETEQ